MVLPHGFEPPYGAPPKAGFVGVEGVLVVWCDGVPTLVTRWPYVQIDRAMQTAHGTLLTAAGRLALVRPDGEFVLLAKNIEPRPVLDATGDRLAVVETQVGRQGQHALHLFDLADGSRHSIAWDEHDFLSALGILDGAVYATARNRRSSVRWTPGSPPEPLPYVLRQVDPYSGLMLASSDECRAMLVRPDGDVVPLRLGPFDMLAPGGRWLYRLIDKVPGIRVADVCEPGRFHDVALPGGSETSLIVPARPIWEDADHVLAPAADGLNDLRVPLVRVHVGTGAMERIALPAEGERQLVIVAPLLVPASWILED